MDLMFFIYLGFFSMFFLKRHHGRHKNESKEKYNNSQCYRGYDTGKENWTNCKKLKTKRTKMFAVWNMVTKFLGEGRHAAEWEVELIDKL